MAKPKQRQLTPYGRWIKIKLIERDMTARQLAQEIGAKPQRLNEIMYGLMPGTKYRPDIEKVLGAKPPARVTEIGSDSV
jgi:ribosome-binding protein aMBF1 (putative translation factor)